ncbi:MAG: hypothetical protein P4L33_08690 [Capsulimonadaceae bacterium]|nr:hypothetical protein [Capsulimonadaceae bacterium]
MQDEGFKTCQCCAKRWNSREDFLADTSFRVVRLRADVKHPYNGLMLFIHRTKTCGATLAVAINQFFDLYTGPRFTENRALTPGCPRHCLDEYDLGRCDVPCQCALARDTFAVVADRLLAARDQQKIHVAGSSRG